MRAMTIGGLCIFLDINRGTWNAWRAQEDDYSEVIARAEEIIYDQKFSGAAADLLNPNIIARDLGLRDKTDVDHGLQANNPITELIKQISGRTLDPNERG